MAIDFSREIVIRWPDQDPRFVPLLKRAAVDVVLAAWPGPEFATACRAGGIRVEAEPEGVIEKQGLWPGIVRPNASGDRMVSEASYAPWIDANGFRVQYLKALGKPPVLGYRPDESAGLKPDRMVPYDSLELALADAFTAGGNYVLALEARYRERLLAGDSRAESAWDSLGRTARWLKENAALFRRPVVPAITALMDSEDTAELANLMFRRGASPALENAARLPAPDPSRRVIVAASLKAADPRILAHAEAGATVVADDNSEKAWWRRPSLRRLRSETDRDWYGIGHGQLLVYHDRIEDPSEFAFDVIDVLGQQRRPVRLFNSDTIIGQMRHSPPTLVLVNYGSSGRRELVIHVAGLYRSALLLRPEEAPLKLRAGKRGPLTEIFVDNMRRTAVVLFE